MINRSEPLQRAKLMKKDEIRLLIGIVAILAVFLAGDHAVGAPPTVASISPSLGPKGQWIYVHGTNFTQDIGVYFGDIEVRHLAVYHAKELGFTCPTDVKGTYAIRVKNADGEAKAPTLYTVGTPTRPPEVTDVRVCPNQWVYLSGDNFVCDHTTVTFKETKAKVCVYSPKSAGVTMPIGFTKSSTFMLTTPNGSVMSYGK